MTELSRTIKKLQQSTRERNKKMSEKMYEKFKRRILFEIEKSASDTVALHLYNVLLLEKEAILKEVCFVSFIVCLSFNPMNSNAENCVHFSSV